MSSPGNQAGNEGEEELHRAKVIQVHGPRKVVEAVERVEDGAANRFAGVADDKVYARGETQQLLDQCLNGLSIRQIAGKNVGAAAPGFDLLFHFEQLVGGAGHKDQTGFRAGEGLRQAFADAEACSGDKDGLAGQALLEFGATEPKEGKKEQLHFMELLKEETRRFRIFQVGQQSGTAAITSARKKLTCSRSRQT